MSTTLRVLRFARRGPDGRHAADDVDPEAPPSSPVAAEWLVTNGLGGYAAGSAAGVITRRFHGLLIAALPAPLGRTMMVNHLEERVRAPGGVAFQIGAQSTPEGTGGDVALAELIEVRLEDGLPVWRWEHAGIVLERRVVLPYQQNTVVVVYRMLAGERACFSVEPWLHFRPHDGALDLPLDAPYALTAIGDRYEVSTPGPLPPLRMHLRGEGSRFRIEGKRVHKIRFAIEQSRGYDAVGDLYTPGAFEAELAPGADVAFVASVEPWDTALALSPEEACACERERRRRLLAAAHPKARTGLAAELVLAADAFVVSPSGRVVDSAHARARGDEVRTVIAGYHWFTDWGRDTMISLEGLTLTTGRRTEAGYILRTFARYVRDGLLPNLFPEGKSAGLYHTADATLWFFHAIDRYLAATNDRVTLLQLMPCLLEIVGHHLRGTRFGIGVDPHDGLLRQGEAGYQLTWMDAKVGDLVVTPRRGKAVEINALFYNALRLLEGWVREEMGDAAAAPFAEQAARARAAFNARFWYAEGGYLYDVVDGEQGDDPSFRPNQIFALSLKHPVLDEARWAPVLAKVKDRLLTPRGLRSLAPGHPDYKSKYFGDLRSRDMAYHQGTVWAWLIGPFLDAFRRVHPEDRDGPRRMLEGFEAHLREGCLGSVSEIFDAEEPYTPRGCVAQAWSVAEVLRSLVEVGE